METIYKLTDENMRTYNDFQWEIGKTYETNGRGDLCGPGWLHAYTDPLLAVLLNPIHADLKAPRLFRGEGLVGKTDGGLKIGCSRMVLREELPLPQVTTEQRIKFAIYCALEVYKEPNFTRWAQGWLAAADAAARAAYTAAAAARAAYAADAIAGQLDFIKLARRAMEE
jgi:hypothetical protein